MPRHKAATSKAAKRRPVTVVTETLRRLMDDPTKRTVCNPDGQRLFDLLFEYDEDCADFSVDMSFEGVSEEVLGLLEDIVIEAEIRIEGIDYNYGVVEEVTQSLKGAFKKRKRKIFLAEWDHPCIGDTDEQLLVMKLRFFNSFPSIQKNRTKLLAALEGMESYENYQRQQIESFSDVIIRVGQRSIKCHKLILAHRSQVFNAMLQHEMMEQKSNEIHIEDFDEETVQSMVDYLYGGDLHDRAKTDTELLRIADKYNIERLKRECEFCLKQNLRWESVAEVWSIANMCSSVDLKKSTIEFLKEHWDEGSQRKELVELLESHPDIIAHVVPFLKVKSK